MAKSSEIEPIEFEVIVAGASPLQEEAGEEVQQVKVEFGAGKQAEKQRSPGVLEVPDGSGSGGPAPQPRRSRGRLNLPFLDDIRSRKQRPSTPTFIQELAALRAAPKAPFTKSGASSATYNETIDINPSPMTEEEPNFGSDVLKVGSLTKTSQSRSKKAAAGHSRARKFRLTHESLDYLQTFSHVKVKRSYPLTAVEEVVYDELKNPQQFQLMFSTYVMTLVAESAEDARDWVEKINGAWSMWQVTPGNDVSPSDEVSPSNEDSPGDIPPPGAPLKSQVSRGKKPVRFDLPPAAEIGVEDGLTESHLELESPTDVSPPPPPLSSREKMSNIPERFQSQRQRSNSAGPTILRRHSTAIDELGTGTYDSRKKRISRRAFRIVRLKPSLERLDRHDPERGHDPAQDRLHREFSMIKYPNKILHLPSERIFTIDKDNLQILWRTVTKSGFREKSSLSLRKIVEIRRGQETTQFDKFPYEQVEEQSFSLLFESENNKYAKLSSLDLICDQTESFNEWMEGLETLVSSTQWLSLFPPRYENTDPTILWLKQLWTCKSDGHELKQHDAIKLAKKFTNISHKDASTVVKVAHGHQFKHTFNYGAALRWDGFVLMFYLLCDRHDLQLYDIFLQYAKKYPSLGMTTEEFRKFLIKECHWPPMETKPSVLLNLMKTHDDEHHQSIKKFCAGNKPKEYQVALKLLSFAGFLSFLRSRDNSVINLEHETVYQDMTQPMSHYFINSSHNTYLEGDQLRGTSSTDAYVRVLLQGCRCVEIDCWDDVLNVNGLAEREPVIYHGHTLTTKIAFRDVIHAINNYGFSSSVYPIIISIENHCSHTQQSRMAKIFRAIFAERLPRENLVELEGRDRLPSPEELQGKIILKGSLKSKKGKKNPQVHTVSRANLNVAIPQSQSRTSLPLSPLPRTPTSPAPAPESSITSAHKAITKSVSNPVGSVSPPHRPRDRAHSRGAREQTDGSGSPFVRRARIKRSRGSLRVIRDRLQQTEQGQDDQELIFTETAEDLSALIVYCRATSIKPWDWNKQKETTVSQMFSFGEPTAVVLCKKCPKDMLQCTERQLIRTYPKGTRFDSSNYDPMQMWKCGIQLVALNFQYPGLEMHLNQGFFRLNGGCGYVLKPLVMRRDDPGGTGESGEEGSIRPGGKAPYNPEMMVPHPAVTPVHLEIELLSGQRLSSWKRKCNYLTVDIHTYGITHDTKKMKQASHVNPFWPSWKKGEHVLSQQILMPELCLVYFRVENESHKLYGQNCFPLISLISGLKFIPLRTNGGEIIPESGLFVRIRKLEGEEEEEEEEEEEREEFNPTLPTIHEDDIDVTASLNPAALGKPRGENGTSYPSPRRLSSPPVLQFVGRSSSDTSADASVPSVISGDNEVVLTVEIHPDDGLSLPTSPAPTSPPDASNLSSEGSQSSHSETVM